MANVRLSTKGTKNPTQIYCRLYNGSLDITSKTNLLVNPAHFDNAKSNYRNIATIKNRAVLRSRLEKLKVDIVERYNESFMTGDVIDKEWLSNAIAEFFNRPKQEKKLKTKTHFIYFTDFMDWWNEHQAPTHRTAKNTYLCKRERMKYEKFTEIFKGFQTARKNKSKYKIIEINETLINEFADYLLDDVGYTTSTVKRHISRTKFYILRAKALEIKTNPSANNTIYVRESDKEVVPPYFNEQQIQKLYELDLSEDEILDNVRDNTIIGCWTGLRISDFNHQLNVENIKDGYIYIKTTKTSNWVTIPLHPQVTAVLNKRLGLLPSRINDADFNKRIKALCKLAGFTDKIYGGITMKKEGDGKVRKVYGMYPMYKLISSHTCRRSFCTNLYGKVPNHVIMSAAGWKTEDMMLKYMKKTKKENADVLKDFWNLKYN